MNWVIVFLKELPKKRQFSPIRTIPSAPEFHRVMLRSSRAIPPVGNYAPPRRIYSFLFAMMVARSVNRVNRYSSIFCECTFLSKNSTASINTIAIGRQIHTFCTNPAIIYETNDTAAATIAYGSCVDTWLTWLHCAPADAMIVVSEIGEQ